jgi:hypothetical protein
MRNKRRDKRLPYINPLSILNSSIGLSLTRIEAKAKLIHSMFHFLHYVENLIFKIIAFKYSHSSQSWIFLKSAFNKILYFFSNTI